MKEKALLLSLLLFTATGQAAVREPAKQQVARAQLAYQAGDYGASAGIYGEVAGSLADNGGIFEQELLYSGASAAAMAGNRDQALDFLERAVKAGLMQADRIRHDASLASLQGDPRLEALLTDIATRKARSDKIWNSPGFAVAYSESLSEDQRVAGLSRLWSEAKFSFANFDRVPDLDWDALYLETLPKVRAAPDTYAYYRELQAFISRLQDGHSTLVLRSASVRDRFQARPGLSTSYVEGRVLVRDVFDPALRAAGIKRGWELLTIDGEPVSVYAERELRPYTSASTPQDLRSQMYERSLLQGALDKSLSIGFSDPRGKEHVVKVGRMPSKEYTAARKEPAPFEWKLLPGNVAQVTLRSFTDNTAADQFEAAFSQISRADAIIFDLRDNGGGNSNVGYRILSLLTDRPFQTSAWRTPDYKPALRAWSISNPDFNAGAGEWPHDGKRHYAKPVLVLTSARTYSAAEDFVVAFDAMHRGRIVGEPTGGSTGSPMMFNLPGGVVALICTKRDTYPDGKEFVGVGIMPQVEVHPTVADYRGGRDTVLEAAVRLARAGGR
ncbi:carboxyl-terminal processing protease [Stenotrophomonas sp. AN71]|uniref:S41 family peptidase n=1 Tax=Stenotrophomonas sp. AN71 TaxID=3156253 RepID=UPI003D262B7D